MIKLLFRFSSLRNQLQVIFEQDGTPPHWGLQVRQFLNDIFPEKWIGLDDPIPWPPRFPDITLLDFA